MWGGQTYTDIEAGGLIADHGGAAADPAACYIT